MKAFYTFLASIAFCLTSIAQEQLLVISPKLVYEKPNSRSLEKGILLRGAKVQVLNTIKDSWYEVTLDNGTKGFITKNDLGDTLFGHDEYQSSPSPIIDMDDYYGSPHLFVINSKVPVYKDRNTTSSILGTLSNGTPIALSYYPFNETEWINIGSFKKENNAYIKQTALGERPVFKELEDQYNKAEQSEDQLRLSQEMLELSWQNNLEDQKTALEYAIQLAERSKDSKKKPITDPYYSMLREYYLQYPLKRQKNFLKLTKQGLF